MSVELFASAELSDVGRKRKNNEDSCLRIPERGVYCVADGMGGVAGGDLASEAITTNVHETFANAKPEEYETLSGTVALLRAAANKASKWIKDFADEKVIGQMGSTFVGLVFDPRNPSRARALHAGDSRVYRWREGKLEQLTADHTAARALAAKLGRDASTFPAKYHNELARAVGLKETVELEETKVQVRSGDEFLLCCDGLYRMAPDQEIGKVMGLSKQEDLGQTARELINLANEAGGKDNITVVLIKVGDISTVAGVEERDTDESPGTAEATLVPERDVEIKAKEDLNPPTPDTAKAGRAKTPNEERTPSQKAGQPGVKPRPNNLLLAITTGVLVVTAIVVVYHNFQEKKAQKQAEMADATNTAATNGPATNVTGAEATGANGPPPETAATNVPTPVAPTPPAPAPGGLVIQSEPAAAVFSNGVKVGGTPYEMRGLPAGRWTYQLGTMTHTGAVVAVVTAGTTNTTNVTLTARTGTLTITSDPTNAVVLVDGQVKGNTPAHLQMEAGERQVELQYPSLADLRMPLAVKADQEVQTNVAFAYGSVKLLSEPPGAEVRWKGHIVGRTPQAAGPLPPGDAEWQLSLTNYTPSNVTIRVPADRRTVTNLVSLQRGRGWLQLSVSPAEAQVWLNGEAVSNGDASLPVEAGRTNALMAEFNQQHTNVTVTVNMGQTNKITLAFKTPPAVATPPVTALPPIAPRAAVGGNVWTNKLGRLMWTNRLGMVFVKLPEEKLWVQTTRVTPKQFELIAVPNSGDDGKGKNDDPSCAVVPLQQARAFANNLTKKLRDEKGLPPGYEHGHLDLLTHEQWQTVGEKSDGLGIDMKKSETEQSEWASDGTGQEPEAYSCSYKLNRKPEFYSYKLKPEDSPGTATQRFRLVLVE